MILTQPRTIFKQADFFTKWLSYGHWALDCQKKVLRSTPWGGVPKSTTPIFV